MKKQLIATDLLITIDSILLMPIYILYTVSPGLQDNNSISLHGIKGSLQSGPACFSTLFSQHLFIICFLLQSCASTCGFPLSHASSHFYILLFVILENSCILQDSPQNAIQCFLLLLFQIFLCVAQLTSICLCFLNSVWSMLNWECL